MGDEYTNKNSKKTLVISQVFQTYKNSRFCSLKNGEKEKEEFCE